MTGSRLRLISIGSIIGAILIGAFQNCSPSEFALQDESSNLINQTDISSNASNQESVEEVKDVERDMSTTPLEGPVSFASCKSFQELDGDVIHVPPSDEDGICYYIKMMSASPSRESGSFGEARATDVFARAHYPNRSRNPFILGEKQIQELVLLGKRNVALSGSFSNPNATMFIDNFFLLEQEIEARPFTAWAYGTADAEPRDGGKISVNGINVDDFFAYASGGRAQISAINLTPALPAELKMSIRFRGLDCGGSAVASDVFLVFH